MCVHREGGMEGDIHVIAFFFMLQEMKNKKCMSSVQSHDKVVISVVPIGGQRLISDVVSRSDDLVLAFGIHKLP